MNTASILPNYIFDKETGWRVDMPLNIMPGNRALCLYRVSTDKQLYHNEQNDADIPMQRVRCREFAESMGYEIVCELQEEGISGHKVRAENRDKIQLIKEYTKQNKFDILIVFMFDRIGRIADETPFVVEWLISHGIRVISATEGEQRIDTHTDRLLNYIRFWQADGESQKTSIRTANSLHILTEQGHFTGGKCPYGYMLVKSSRMNKRKQEVNDLVICDEEAAVVRMMFKMASVDGYGGQSIANQLAKMGYKNRRGSNWHPSTINAMLKNVVYVGVLRSGETRSDVLEHLRIVDDKTFNNVQEMLKARSREYQEKRSAPLNIRGNSLLSGNIFCGYCGARLCLTTTGKGRAADGKEIRRTRYTCQTKSRKHENCGGQTGYTKDKLDAIIDRIMRDIFSKVRGISRRELVQTQYDRDFLARKNHVQRIKKDYEKAVKELKCLQDEIVKSLTGESEFSPQMLKVAIGAQEDKCFTLSKTLHEAEQELENCEEILLGIAEKHREIISWAEAYDNADIAAKKNIVSHIIDKVTVYRDYELKVELNISVEQFLDTIEYRA